MRLVVAITGVGLVATLPAAGQSHWYGGIAGGTSKTNRELVDNRESTITFASDLRSDFDARDGAWKAFAGYRLNRVIALEASYADLGSHRVFTRLQGGDPPFPASIAIDRKISGYGIDLVASPPLDWKAVSLFARMGAFRSRLEAAAALDGNIVFTSGDSSERMRTTTRRETVLKYGIGGDWWITRNIATRLEWEHYSAVGKPFAIGGTGTTGQADTEVVSLGVVVRF